jgi:hypothetical protein
LARTRYRAQDSDTSLGSLPAAALREGYGRDDLRADAL